MSFSKETFTQNSPPHIHSGDSVAKRNWLRAIALLPVLIAALWLGFPDFLRTAFLGLACVTGFDWMATGFFRKNPGLANGDAALNGLLFVLLLPAKCSPGHVMLGAFMTAVVANSFFGGPGSRPFHAPAFGCGVLELVFPGSLAGSVVFCAAGIPWMAGAVAASALFLAAQRQVYWEAWLYVLGVFSAGAFFFGYGPGGFTLAAFFAAVLFGDPSVLPLTRRGTNLFAIGATLLAVLFGRSVSMAAAASYAILIMNGASPWLDVWYKPAKAEGTR